MIVLARGLALDDRHTLLRPIGGGGLADLWLARDAERDEDVVAKIVASEVGEDRHALIEHEGAVLERLDHPSIVRAYALRRRAGVTFLTLEHLPGGDLGSLRAGAPAEVVTALLPIASALAHAHSRGVVHRDIKVSNVLRGSDGRPRLIDFGVATAPGGPSFLGGGTRSAVSPQMLRHEAARPSDDVYGFGALLYELLAGRPPFWPAPSDEQILEVIAPAVTSLRPLPARLVELVGAMLAKSAGDRPGDMNEVMGVLRSLAPELMKTSDEAVAAPAVSPTPPERPRAVKLTPPPRPQTGRPQSPEAPATPRPLAQRRRLTAPAVAGITLLSALAVWVFAGLPSLVDSTPPAVVEAPVAAERPLAPRRPAPAPTAPPVVPADALAQARAEAALLAASQGAKAAAAVAAAVWAPEELAAARRQSDAGDEGLRQRDYAAAATAYEAAAAGFSELTRRAAQVFGEAVATGAAALAAGERDAAIAAFDLALQIRPGDATARAGRERAEVQDGVTAALERGAVDEASGALGRARLAYRAARDLDPRSPQARAALGRVEARIAEREFQRTMSEAHAALERRDWDTARAAFQRAGRQRPSAGAVRAGLARVESGILLERIARHRTTALELERDERWADAVAEYDAVLTIDPTLAFAIDGRGRTRERAELGRNLRGHRDHPERLHEPAVMVAAEALLERAAEVEPKGPRHQRLVADVRAEIERWSRPVRVTLTSDGQTEVSLHRLGRLGSFESHTVELRPGTYIVVGSRRGYRDVRRELRVVAGGATPKLEVRCEERI